VKPRGKGQSEGKKGYFIRNEGIMGKLVSNYVGVK